MKQIATAQPTETNGCFLAPKLSVRKYTKLGKQEVKIQTSKARVLSFFVHGIPPFILAKFKLLATFF